MKKQAIIISLFAVLLYLSCANKGGNINSADTKSDRYLFYLHGAIVQDMGLPAISPYYGVYEYKNIISRLSESGATIISEVRPRNTKEKDYAKKLSSQIDSLLESGVSPGNIMVLGASMGAYIALEAALLQKNPQIHYAILGLCSQYAIDYFTPFQQRLKGKFLSIYEKSDSKSSCKAIFLNHSENSFREIELNLGIDHAFLYKPHEEWVSPVLDWIFDE